MAGAGMLVVAGLKSNNYTPPLNTALPGIDGHVAIVVAGALDDGKYPIAYWGTSAGVSGRKQTLRSAWNAVDFGNVYYAGRSI
jgi:hypothetical protein